MSALFGDPDPLDLVVAELRRYPGWPADDVKDRAFAAEIVEGFPRVDLVMEARAWRVWMIDHESRKEVRPRARFLTWLRRASGNYRGGSAPSRARGGSRSTAPRAAEAFGETSNSVSGW